MEIFAKKGKIGLEIIEVSLEKKMRAGKNYVFQVS
jgi:hypothetical protein